MYHRLGALFAVAVESVKPARLMRSTMRLDSNELIVGDRTFALNGNCYVLGFGKAVYEMAVEVERVVGPHLKRGILCVPRGSRHERFAAAVSVVEGGENNLPDEDAFEAARRMKTLAADRRRDDILLVLVSGGGSALLTCPIAPVTVAEKAALVKSLAAAGADIREVNAVRAALSELKGGRLALLASPATVVAFILSDIVGDPLDLVAGGPTVLPRKNWTRTALSVLAKYRLEDELPDSVKYVLRTSRRDDDCGGAAASAPANVHNVLIGNNGTCLAAMAEHVNSFGGSSVVLTNRVVGSVDDVTQIYSRVVEYVGVYLLRDDVAAFRRHVNAIKGQHEYAYVDDVVDNLTRNARQSLRIGPGNEKALFLMSAGEPTVRVRGRGKGGRNQELSLRMASALHGLRNRCEWTNKLDVYFLSAGTDGIDGPTDAAGAIVDSSCVPRALTKGLNPDTYVGNNDSYTFFSKFENGNCLIKTGHTGTNVMDVHIIVFVLK